MNLVRFKVKDSPYRFNPRSSTSRTRAFAPADNLCAFVERLPHVKGPLAGQPTNTEPWQIFILTTVFGWVKPDGKRRFRRAYIEVPRGNVDPVFRTRALHARRRRRRRRRGLFAGDHP